MKSSSIAALVLLSVLFVACDGTGGPTPTPSSVQGLPTGTVVDEAVVTQPPTPDEAAPTPTEVTATSTGDAMTALQALALLRIKAQDWQADARLGLLANTRPGQQSALLGGTLGSPEVNEPTPGGRGRNWTLVAFSPGAKGAMAFGVDGTESDLVSAGVATDEMVEQFTGRETASLVLAALDIQTLVDSDEVVAAAGGQGTVPNVTVVLLSPDGLGMGPLPMRPSGGGPTRLAYELFSGTGAEQLFIIFDAVTGEVVVDSTTP